MPGPILPTSLVTGYSAAAGRLQISLPTPLISHPVISISLDPFRGTSLAICNKRQCEVSCHLLATPDTINLLSWDCALVPWWSKCFVISDTLRYCMYHLPSKCPNTSVSVPVHQSESECLLPYLRNSFSYFY